MAVAHAKPGEPISVRPLGTALAGEKTTTLVKTVSLEVIRLVVPTGKEIPTHRVAGEVTVQCLEGRVAFTAGDHTRDLEAGQLLFLPGNEPHSVRGVENASLLVTILLR
jgi:quercetin dioxygenase-like cupin family protein